MTPAEFKKKWSRFQGKETSAYRAWHFDDLSLARPANPPLIPMGTRGRLLLAGRREEA